MQEMRTHMAIAVEGGLVPKALTGFHALAGADLKDRGVPSEH